MENLEKEEIKNLMKKLPIVVESEKEVGNGRHKHYNLAKAISELKTQTKDQELDLITIKFILGDKFVETKKQIKRSFKLLDQATHYFQQASSILRKARSKLND